MKPAYHWSHVGSGVITEVNSTTLVVETEKGRVIVRRETGAGGVELASPLVGKEVGLIRKRNIRGYFGNILAENK